jgi:hypothetical protein
MGEHVTNWGGMLRFLPSSVDAARSNAWTALARIFELQINEDRPRRFLHPLGAKVSSSRADFIH